MEGMNFDKTSDDLGKACAEGYKKGFEDGYQKGLEKQNLVESAHKELIDDYQALLQVITEEKS